MAKFVETVHYYRLALILWCSATFIIASVLFIEIKTLLSLYCAKKKNMKQTAPDHSHSNSAKPKPKRRKNGKNTKLVVFLPILSYIFYLISCICALVAILGAPSPKVCNIAPLLAPALYTIAKNWMYLVFVYRLFIIYNDSLFAYNNKILFAMAIIIVIYSISISSVGIFSLKPRIINHHLCGVFIPAVFLIITVIFDITVSSLCCYLFIRPLLLLNNMKCGMDSNKHSTEMRSLVLKYAVLTFVAVTSTLFVLILLGITKITALITIDYSINCICIMLFSRKYDKYFNIVCCGTMKMCSKLFDIGNKKQTGEESKQKPENV